MFTVSTFSPSVEDPNSGILTNTVHVYFSLHAKFHGEVIL